MLKIVRIAGILLAWLYAGLIALWLLWHHCYGDTIWWLALVSSFAPFLFAPLVLFVPVGLWMRTRAYWLGLALPVVTFLFMYGALFLPRWPAAYVTNPKPLKIMTFNILDDSRSPENPRAILQNGLPDIVAVQELSDYMDKQIRQQVGQFYPYQVFDPGGGAQGLGVFSRYPLTELSSKYLFEIDRQIQIMRVQVGERTFILYNCHPSSSNIPRYLRAGLPIAREVQESFARRTALVKQLTSDIAERTEPIIVVGDLNSTPQSDVYKILSERLLDSHQEAGWGLGHTFPSSLIDVPQFPLLPRLIRIDMIFHSPEFVALDSYVSSAHGESDHLPVVAQLAWKQ